MNSFGSHPQSKEEKELYFRSEMNNLQFKALAHRLTQADIENEILNNRYFQKKILLSRRHIKEDVGQWLKNSWNTEQVLALNQSIINDSGQSFCMQWAFPQAYYAVYGSIMAMFNALGYTETAHTTVLRKYASLMLENKLPESISICCDGREDSFEYYNIIKPDYITGNLELDLHDEITVDNQICRFLSATRKLRLEDKKGDFKSKFRTKNGGFRKKFEKEHWQQVSEALGPTSIIDFLYRKRIKGNYEDIETYSCEYFNGSSVLGNLVKIVDRINLVNETYIAKAVGYSRFKTIAENHLDKVDNPKLRKRLSIIEPILEA